MKKIIYCILVSSFICSSVFAETNVCPTNINITNGKPIIPNGFYVTENTISSPITDQNFIFYVASYNFDHQIGENGDKISCYYVSPPSITPDMVVEITTTNGNIPLPSGINTKWNTSAPPVICGFPLGATPSDCPWTK